MSFLVTRDQNMVTRDFVPWPDELFVAGVKEGNPFGTQYRIARRSGAAGGSSSLPWEAVDKERWSKTLEKYIQNPTLPGAMPQLYDERGQELSVRAPPHCTQWRRAVRGKAPKCAF